MTTNTGTFSRHWISAVPLVVVFAIGSTAANAQSIGTAQSVKPEASGSIGGTLSAGSGIHANETIKTGSSGQAACSLMTGATLVLDHRHRSDSTSLCMIRTRAPAAWR